LRCPDASAALSSTLLDTPLVVDPDFSEYNSLLRNGILEAYSGIIQGLGQAKADHYLKAQVPDIVAFVSSIGAEAEFDEDAAKAAVNLLGDICSVFAVRVSGSVVLRGGRPLEGWGGCLSSRAERYPLLESCVLSLSPEGRESGCSYFPPQCLFAGCWYAA
jgi:hypothetical protein